MKLQSKYADVVLNLLVAVAISLVVNFSYVLLMLVDLNNESTQQQPAPKRALIREDEGRLVVHPDGYGYLVYENGDSAYVPTQRMNRLRLAAGDRIVAEMTPPRRPGAHPMMQKVLMRNGREFDYSMLYSRPSRGTELLLSRSSPPYGAITPCRATCVAACGAARPPRVSTAWRPSPSGTRGVSCSTA